MKYTKIHQEADGKVTNISPLKYAQFPSTNAEKLEL